jgi:7-carboxy-7-deazaguanine synthase
VRTYPRYPVSAVYKTIQGEGHFVGYPCVLIRLAGCSVTGCSIRRECDEAPWKATETAAANELARRAWEIFPGGIALITGGEPTDHDLIPLIDLLRSYGLRVHLETSGVRSVDGWPLDWLTVSPKTPDYVQRSGHVLKIVARYAPNWDEVLALDAGTTFFHRYLQPLTAADRTSNAADVIAMIGSRENPGGRWALSTQAHKAWGLR